MTEVMMHTVLDKSFSFTGSKFNHIQGSHEAEVPKVQNDESKESFENQIKANCAKYLISTERESHKDDSQLNDVQISDINLTNSDTSSKQVVQTESNASSDDYKVLATKTTVINTTYNLIAQSRAREIMNMTSSGGHSSWPSFPNVMTEAVDKSRVIVQVLKSDVKSKSQNVIDSKSSNTENQSVHSFRDDLYKLLSKSHSSKVDEAKNSKFFPERDTLDMSDTYQHVSSESQDSKTHIVKARRKRNLNFYFWNGRGTKIGDLKCVCDNLRQASPASLRYLHYVMFNSFGLCGTGLQLLETKKNITSFCGYPFKRSSEQFQKKLKCIAKIPGQMLAGIHRAIFGKTSVLNRSVMIDQLVDFLWMPKKCNEILKKYDNKIKYMSEDEYAALKESAIRGPALSIVLQKLPENYIRKYTNNYVNKNYGIPECLSANQNQSPEIESKSSRSIPAFILNGPGTKLKYFPRISNNIQTVHERPIKMLHYILYGRIEPSVKDCRRNILEFNGFSDCQLEFASERKDIVKKLNQKELLELCQILCLRAKTCSREMRIRKILDYLQLPSKPAMNKSCKTSRWAVPISSRSGRLEACLSKRSSYKSVCKRKKYSSVFRSPECNFRVPKPYVTSSSAHSNSSDDVFSDDGLKLRDFRTICSNVECAAPSDLIELNDLLFLKTCDETDIHQKILDFTGFCFPVNSFHYDSRKTLMHYMGFCVVRKIARLLDIENWDKILNPEDLSTNILKFLMKNVEPVLPSSSKSVTVSNLVSEQLLSSKSVVDESSVIGSSSPASMLENCPYTNPETPKSLKSEFYQHTNQAFSHQKGKVIIQRLTKASIQTKESCQSNESDDNKSVQISEEERFNLFSTNAAEDDSTRLRDLIHHPSEQELKDLIFHLVKENLWSFTLGDLVQKVYAYYPKVNLSYQESFIKATARQMLSELRDYAVSAVKDQTL